MKKLLSIILSLLFLFNLSACGSKTTPPKDIFSMDYPTTEESLDYFVDNDSFETLAIAGPFYAGNQHQISQGMRDYQELLQTQIDDSTQLTYELFQEAMTVEKELQDLKKAYNEAWDTILPEVTEYRIPAKDSAEILISNQLRVESLIASYNSIDSNTDNSVVKANLEYTKTFIVFDLTNAVSQDYGQFTELAALLVNEFIENENPIIKKTATEFNKKMDEIEVVTKSYNKLLEKSAETNYSLKKINTAQYYMGLASLKYIEEQIPELKTSLAVATANEKHSQEDLDFMQEYINFIEVYTKEIKESLDSTAPETLIELDDQLASNFKFYLTETALAQDGRTYISDSFSSFKKGEYIKGAKIVAKANWDTLKDQARKLRNVAGSTAEMVKAASKSFGDWYYGTSNKEIKENIAENIKIMRDNIGIENDNAGGTSFQDAEKYFEWAEQQGGDAAEGLTEKIVGKGNTSWLMGHAGKMTVGMFTGFGKGVAKVLDQEASDGKLAEGFLDIGLSFIGGTKAIGSASQLKNGTKESFKLLGKKGGNYLKRFFAGQHIKKLKNISAEILKNKKLTAAQIGKLLSSAESITNNQEIQKKLILASKSLNSEFSKLLKDGAETILTNATKSTKESYKDFVEEGFKQSLSGYKSALKKVLGNGMDEYIDNLVASKMDDLLKTTVKDYIDKRVIPGIGGPFDGKYSGTYTADGLSIPISMTVTDDEISSKLTTNFTFELWGEPVPVSINIKATGSVNTEGIGKGSSSGTLTFGGEVTSISGGFTTTFTESSVNFVYNPVAGGDSGDTLIIDLFKN